MADDIGNLPFDEFIRYLNGGYYLDTFEVGSIKIDPISWPTSSRDRKPKQQSDIVDEILNRPWIDHTKFTGLGFDKSPADEGKEKKKSGSDLPPIRKSIKITCARNQTQILSKTSCSVKKLVKSKVSVSKSPENMDIAEEKKSEGTKRKLREQYEVKKIVKEVTSSGFEKLTRSGFEKSPADENIAKKKVGSDIPQIRKVIKITCARNQTQSFTKKEEDCSSKVKKMGKKVCVSTSPQNKVSEEERKLEETKRKLRERYDVIENEKKKRRVQIIDFLKPEPPCVQPPVKKQQKRKPVHQMLSSTRKLSPLHFTNSVC